jgi:hypothetical protein
VGGGAHRRAADGRHPPPGDPRRLRPQAQERQRRLGHDGLAHARRRRHRHRRPGVQQDVLERHHDVVLAQRLDDALQPT